MTVSGASSMMHDSTYIAFGESAFSVRDLNAGVIAKQLNALVGGRVVQAFDLFVELRLAERGNGLIGQGA
jgi:hypothetical protein